MRKELEEIKYIEDYLHGKLDKAAQLEFEQALNNNAGFKLKVEQQKSLMEGIKNLGVKKSIAKSFKKFKFNNKLKWGLGGASIITIALVSTLLFLKPSAEIAIDTTLDDFKRDTGVELPLDQIAGSSLPNQLFTIHADQDTVIASEDGMILAIQKGTFLNKDGSVFEGEIQLSIKEALTEESILSSGLSTTTTSGQALQTGGMFQIKAFGDGEELTIDPKKGILTQVPTDEVVPGMKLFDGEYQKDGQVRWKEPKELEKFLIPIDMSLLNFYPPNFEKTLTDLGFVGKDKHFKDSVYYSFGAHFSKKGRSQFINPDYSEKEGEYFEHSEWERDQIFQFRYPLKTGLLPAKVKAIWDNKFNGTLIATREFEARMKEIHKTGNSEVLEVYLQNLEKPLSEIDALAAAKLTGVMKDRFLKFSEEKKGRVNTNFETIKVLNRYYRKQELKYKKAQSKVAAFWQESIRKEKKFKKEQQKKQASEIERTSSNFVKEFQDNLKDVYKQLGIKTIRRPNRFYRFRVVTTGIKNIDVLVAEATVKRSSTTITHNGKTAKIVYKSLGIKLDQQYDRVYPYIITEKLPSYQRMDKDCVNCSKGNSVDYSFNINQLYSYALGVIAYKGTQVYTFMKEEVKGDTVMQLKLEASTEDDFYKKVKKWTGRTKAKDIWKDLNFENIKQTAIKEKEELNNQVNFRRELQEDVFPLYYMSLDNYVFWEDNTWRKTRYVGSINDIEPDEDVSDSTRSAVTEVNKMDSGFILISIINNAKTENRQYYQNSLQVIYGRNFLFEYSENGKRGQYYDFSKKFLNERGRGRESLKKEGNYYHVEDRNFTFKFKKFDFEVVLKKKSQEPKESLEITAK